ALQGRFQPHFQWQSFHYQGNPVLNTGALAGPAFIQDRQRIDVGVHYVMDAFNARATLVYFNERPSDKTVPNTNGITLAMQIQF
ncbi:MAG: hypothetical protein VCB78_03840, partial [Myxococcota bacterium]